MLAWGLPLYFFARFFQKTFFYSSRIFYICVINQLTQNKMARIKKEYAMETLKNWADQNLVMIENRTWMGNSVFPDGKNTVGTLVNALTGKDEFYFDDNEFVRGDKTIFVVRPEKSTTKDLFNKLVELNIINQ